MFRALVVEDEPALLDDLCALIRNQGVFEVAGTASNGAEGLERVKALGPDVLFTDIRMPVVDGIELIREARLVLPDLACVILSGYNDFSLVKRALQAGTVDYLLKPVSEQELLETSRRLGDQLKTSVGEREVLFWKDILADRRSGRPKPEGSPFLPVLLTLGPRLTLEKDRLVPDEVATTVDRLAARVVEVSSGHCWTLTPGPRNSLLVVFRRGYFRDSTHQTAFLNSCFGGISFPSSVVIGPEFSEAEQVRQALGRLQEQVYGQPLVPRVPSQEGGPVPDLSAFTKSFPATCRRSSPAGVQREIVDVLTTLLDSGGSQADLEKLLSTICGILSDERGDLDALTLDAVQDELLRLLFQRDARHRLAADVGLFFAKNLSEALVPHHRIDLVRRIDAYLMSHLADPISLGDLGQLMDLDPNYLSSTYRKSKGQSPIQRHTWLRMERAAALLLERPELLIKDVAEIVGFKDQTYFTKVFKRAHGCDPSDFRG